MDEFKVKFDRMNRKGVLKYLDFLMWHYRLLDALWFLEVEDKYGLEAASKMNEVIWERIGRRAAKDIKEKFELKEKGVRGVLKALSFFPWMVICDYDISIKNDEEAVLRITRCLPQEARVKRGMKLNPCREMQLREFSAFAKEIDENVEVECIYAPPDSGSPRSKDEAWCEWKFRRKR